MPTNSASGSQPNNTHPSPLWPVRILGSREAWQSQAAAGAPAEDVFEPGDGAEESKAVIVPSAEYRRVITELHALLQDPINLEILADPVVNSVGRTYERASLQRALARKPIDPETREPVKHTFVENRLVRSIVEHFAHDFEQLESWPSAAARPEPVASAWLQRLRLRRATVEEVMKAGLRSTGQGATQVASALSTQIRRHPRVALAGLTLTATCGAAGTGFGLGRGLGSLLPMLSATLNAASPSVPRPGASKALPLGLAPIAGTLVGLSMGVHPRGARHYINGMYLTVPVLHAAKLAASLAGAWMAGSPLAAGIALVSSLGACFVDLATLALLAAMEPITDDRPRLSELSAVALGQAVVGGLAAVMRYDR